MWKYFTSKSGITVEIVVVVILGISLRTFLQHDTLVSTKPENVSENVSDAKRFLGNFFITTDLYSEKVHKILIDANFR